MTTVSASVRQKTSQRLNGGESTQKRMSFKRWSFSRALGPASGQPARNSKLLNAVFRNRYAASGLSKAIHSAPRNKSSSTASLAR